MECAGCHYRLDVLDDVCPRCGAPNIRTAAGSSAGSQGASPAAHPAAGAMAAGAAASGARATQMAPHSEEQRRRYIGEQWPRHAAMGGGIGLALGVPLCFFLESLRRMALVHYPRPGRSFADTLVTAVGTFPAAIIYGLPFLLAIAALGWLVGKQWQQAAEMVAGAEYGQSGAASVEGLSGHGKILGLVVSLAIAMVFMIWQYFHAQISPIDTFGEPVDTFTSEFFAQYERSPWGEPLARPNYSFVINALRVFLVLTGIVVGYYLGRLQGLLQYNYARNRNFAPAPASSGAGSGARSSSGPVLQLNGGAWAVGVFAFIMPCIGLLLWMSYAKSDEEKAGAACIGSVLGIILAIAIAVLRAVARNAG